MRIRSGGASALLLLALVGCAAAEPGPAHTPTDAGHGEIEGAQELSEPALHLTTVDAEGVVHHLDLLDEQSTVLAEIEPIDDLVTDGRYLFGIRPDSVTVIDSGVWTWSHIDHFHYYEASSRVVGEIKGAGRATVITGTTGIGIRFEDEAVLVDTPALADGEIVEEFRIPAEPAGGFVVPLSEGAAVVEANGIGAVSAMRIVDQDGAPGEEIPCAGASGTITTVVGVVIGCDDGAALAVGGDPDEWERISYPVTPAAPAATEFAARKGRPSVAALAGDEGIWLLDSRARTWTLQNIGEEIVQVAAVDDENEHVLALAADGSVLVLVGGEIVARTEPLVGASLANPDLADGVSFVVDQHRAYLNGPAENLMWEIDPADGARIARVFETSTSPLQLAGTGR